MTLFRCAEFHDNQLFDRWLSTADKTFLDGSHNMRDVALFDSACIAQATGETAINRRPRTMVVAIPVEPFNRGLTYQEERRDLVQAALSSSRLE